LEELIYAKLVLIFVSLCDAGISKAEGRIGRTTTMVLGGTVADESPYEGISMNKMVLVLFRLIFSIKIQGVFGMGFYTVADPGFSKAGGKKNFF
jgi:hypothetical protein